jgi:glycyl-tRNA synthetase beta chain
MKEKKIRTDIINSSLSSFGIDNLNKIYRKSFAINKVIDLELGQDIISSYKRKSNILESEANTQELELSDTTDPGIFKNEYEKNLYKKIKELRKYFLNTSKDDDENYDETLKNLASAKKPVFEFFDNIIVNDKDLEVKKNRLELLQMLCKTFENYINFSKIESV